MKMIPPKESYYKSLSNKELKHQFIKKDIKWKEVVFYRRNTIFYSKRIRRNLWIVFEISCFSFV